MSFAPGPSNKKKPTSPTQPSQPVASGSGSTPRKGKQPKIVKSEDPGFDFEAEGGEINEDDVKNKYKLGEETNSGMENFVNILVYRP